MHAREREACLFKADDTLTEGIRAALARSYVQSLRVQYSPDNEPAEGPQFGMRDTSVHCARLLQRNSLRCDSESASFYAFSSAASTHPGTLDFLVFRTFSGG